MLGAQKVVLTAHRPDVSLKVGGALGEATMSEGVYTPILDILADHQPRSLGQIEQAVRERGLNFAQVMQAAMVLGGAGQLAVVQDEAAIARSKKQVRQLNAHLIDKSRCSNDISYLASPVTGGGVMVGRFNQMFLLARSQGKVQPQDWAQYAWQVLASQGQKLVKDGKTLDTAEANVAELAAQAKLFAEKLLPVLKALQIA